MGRAGLCLAAASGFRDSWGLVASWQKWPDTWPHSSRPGNSRSPRSRVVHPTFLLLLALIHTGSESGWEGSVLVMMEWRIQNSLGIGPASPGH